MRQLDERIAPVYILWISTIAIGLVVVSVGYLGFRKETRDVEALFEAHVASVVLLINEGAREAAASTSLLYEISEGHLLTVAGLLRGAAERDAGVWPRLKSAHRMAVWISSDADGRFDGDFGPIPEAARGEVIQWIREAEFEFLIDDGPLRSLALACVRVKSAARREDIVCKDADDLRQHRREVGIGPLLKGVTQKDIRYVAIQDGTGVLAVSPSSEQISSFEVDPFLKGALARTPSDQHLFRTRAVDDAFIFEGVVPFELADGSFAILRIGIDGARLIEAKKNALSRFVITIAWTTAGVLLATLLFVLLRKWQRKKLELDQRIVKEADARRHWEDIGRMAAAVAHEVRNPLNTIGMIAQRLRSEFAVVPDDKAEFDEMVGLMISEGRRVERVVTDFLSLGKPLVLLRERQSVSSLLAGCARPLAVRAEAEGKSLELASSADVEIYVDADRFRQMLTNLVDNALDAVDQGGRVVISAAAQGDSVDVSITDDGKGLGAEELATAFTPFVSFKSNGNGLGLALVKRMIEAHGGAISLAPNPGPGLTATLSFPNRNSS